MGGDSTVSDPDCLFRPGVAWARVAPPMTTGSSVAPVAPASLALRRHIVETVRLAAPLVVSRVGILVLVAVDIAMTGRVGAAQLAYLGIGTAPQLVLMLVGLGMLRGASVLVSQAHGASDFSACGRLWRVALVHAALLGAFFGVICLFGEWFLLAIGQEDHIAVGGGRVTVMYSLGPAGGAVRLRNRQFARRYRPPDPRYAGHDRR